MNRSVKLDLILAAIAFFFVILVFLLAGCEGGYVVVTNTPDSEGTIAPTTWVTNTDIPPTEEPTPTQETFYCEFNCSDFAGTPINPNACLCPGDNGLPYGMGFRIAKRWGDGPMTSIDYKNGHWVMDLKGPPTEVDAPGFTGDMCVSIYGLDVQSGQTYAVHLEGFSQLDNADYHDALKWIWASASITSQWGRVDMDNQHNFKLGEYPNETVTGLQDFWWYLRSDRPMPHVADLEVCIHQQEAVAATGNTFRIDAMYVVPVDGRPEATEF
jgi:hypothetical protein